MKKLANFRQSLEVTENIFSGLKWFSALLRVFYVAKAE
jgi:hypothetical protein